MGVGLFLAIAAVAGVGLSLVGLPRPKLAPREGLAIGDVRAWGYQLQRVDATRIPAGIDLIVTDYSRDGSDRRAL